MYSTTTTKLEIDMADLDKKAPLDVAGGGADENADVFDAPADEAEETDPDLAL